MTTAGATSEPSTITLMTDLGLTESTATTVFATQETDAGNTMDEEQTGSSVSPDSATQGPGVGNTMAGVFSTSGQTESTATDVSVTDGLDEENTTGEEQTGSPVTAAPVSLGPDADNTTGGAPATESPVTEVPEGQGPGADNTTRDGEQTGSPVTAAPVSLGPDADNTTGGAPVTESPVTEGPEGPGGDNTTRDGEQTGSPVTAGPVTLRPDGDNTTGGENTESPVTGAPVTQDPDTGDTTKAEIEATTAQFNISNFGEFITTYYTFGTGNATSIPLNFGREIIAQMAKENALAFRFFLQARTSGIVTNAFSSTATLASLSGIRQEPEANDEEDELGTEGTTFVSALDRVNKTTTFNNTDCLNTVKLVLMKVEFTNAITGELYPCDLSNQANAKPPYVEIIDVYNRTVINRYCYLDDNVTIHSFGDQMFGYIVTNGDPNVVPDIQAIQTREKYCCGGVFYGAFREPLIVTSPNYPGNYAAHMRCPYVFRCNVDYPDCVIRLEFESFDLASDVIRRNRRQAQPETGSGNTTVAPYVPPTGSDFNRTICNGEDVVRVSQCDSISAVNARQFCASNPPSQVYTGYREVILYFNSQEQKQNQGFVIKFTPRNRRKWIYSDAELDPKCPCANNLPNQIRKFFRKRNKKNKNKTKARNGPLKRVKREEKEKLKERRKGEKKDRSPGVKKRKTDKGGDKGEEKKNRNNRRNNKKDAKEPKRKNKNMKKRVKGGNRGMSGKVEGKGKRQEKKIEKVKRKGKLLSKMEKRLSKRKKTENKVDTDDRVFNGKTNRKRQQYPWLVSVTQYERPLLEGKSPSQRPIERMCGGTLLNDRFVLTTTSCCTYCGPIWAQKNKNNSRKKRDAEGASKKQQDRRKKRKDREGRKNKKTGRKGNDRNTEKKNPRQKKRGRKNKNGKGKNQKDQKKKTDQRKGKGDRKNVDETEEEEEEEEEEENDNNKNKNKEMKASSRKKGTKRRRPLKKDVGAVIGEGAISIKKVTPLKIADILIPRECYDKMSKKELKGQPLYPVQCPVLLKLETKLEYTKFIKPICLPIFDKIKINKERAASIGYGARKLSKIENSKRPVEVVDMRELKKCEKRLKMKLDKTMMCTKGTKKTAHMCLYDEGAPLLNVKITGSGYQQHANIYGALAVPGCKLKSNKGKRRKRDANESKRRGGGKRKANQEKPQSTEPRNKRRLSKQDTRKTKQDKFNPSKTNPYYIDVWIKIRSYKKWILNEVFNGQKSWACQRPKHLPTVPDIAKKFEIEDPCPY